MGPALILVLPRILARIYTMIETDPTEIVLSGQSLVLLVGASGCGKSTFARKHFKPTEILSSDFYRALVSDNEANQAASRDAFEVLHLIAAKRLAAGRLAVVDATNLQAWAREPLLKIAHTHDCQAIALVFDLPEALCQGRNLQRPDRQVAPEVIHRQVELLQASLPSLENEGLSRVYRFTSSPAIDRVSIRRTRLPNNRRSQHGPFDIIGDVHGCTDELERLLEVLGYAQTEIPGIPPPLYNRLYHHPAGRTAIFLGDLVDRGPRILDAVDLVRLMVDAGHALAVLGNHDEKLLRKLRGRNVQVKHGLEKTLAELADLSPQLESLTRQRMIAFFSALPNHYVLDSGKLVVAHAGIKKPMIGRDSPRVREFTLYGETNGEIDEFGLPVRLDWARSYHGHAFIVYGHTPTRRPIWMHRTINIDTGCVFGGKLTALRYPEMTLTSISAEHEYTSALRPIQ